MGKPTPEPTHPIQGCPECAYLFGDHHDTCSQYRSGPGQLRLLDAPAAVLLPIEDRLCYWCQIGDPHTWITCRNHLKGHRICEMCFTEMHKALTLGGDDWIAWEQEHKDF